MPARTLSADCCFLLEAEQRPGLVDLGLLHGQPVAMAFELSARRWVFEVVALLELVGLALGGRVGEARNDTEIVEALVGFLLERGLLLVCADRGGACALGHQVALQAGADVFHVGLRGFQLQLRVQQLLLDLWGQRDPSGSVSGSTRAPGSTRMRMTVASVSAGMRRMRSSRGTSVPGPRTWRSIGPRLTTSVKDGGHPPWGPPV